jgi:hypothetical protein
MPSHATGDESSLPPQRCRPASCVVPVVVRLGTACLGLAIAGCAGALPRPPFAAQAQNALDHIDASPPPGRAEDVPARPTAADAWIDGEWVSRHGRWYWLLGRWVARPPGARYSPWVVVRAVDGTLYYAAGHWVDATGATLPDPPALAFATASGAAVFDAEGETEETGRNIKTRPPPERTEEGEEGSGSLPDQ